MAEINTQISNIDKICNVLIIGYMYFEVVLKDMIRF